MYKVREARHTDWERIKKIYELGIRTGNATFATQAPNTYDDWILNSVQACTLVIEEKGDVIGWSKLTPTSDRCVYAGVGEVSIYIDEKRRGTGVGNQLLQALINASEHQGYWTLTAGIFPENQPSIRLHLKNGFRILGTRERIGKMNNVWRDVLLLERRSDVVGHD